MCIKYTFEIKVKLEYINIWFIQYLYIFIYIYSYIISFIYLLQLKCNLLYIHTVLCRTKNLFGIRIDVETLRTQTQAPTPSYIHIYIHLTRTIVNKWRLMFEVRHKYIVIPILCAYYDSRTIVSVQLQWIISFEFF